MRDRVSVNLVLGRMGSRGGVSSSLWARLAVPALLGVVLLVGCLAGDAAPRSPTPTTAPGGGSGAPSAAQTEPMPTIAETLMGETPTAESAGSGLLCRLGATFVDDVTVPDGTVYAPGEAFVKTWRLRNTGTCSWGSRHHFTFVGGNSMSAPETVTLPATDAGAETEISVAMVAPTEPGSHLGKWRVCATDSACFGDVVTVEVVVAEGSSLAATPEATAQSAQQGTPFLPGSTFWVESEGRRARVSRVSWDSHLGPVRAGRGQIFLSLYIETMYDGSGVAAFSPLEFMLIDGEGTAHAGSVVLKKTPSFRLCVVSPSRGCQGWFTVVVPSRSSARHGLSFRWLAEPLETPLEAVIAE